MNDMLILSGNPNCSDLEEKRNRLSAEYENRQMDEKRRGMVCRDFLRNACNRGSLCKFQHPDISLQKPSYLFCHDFQNGGCGRNNFCKFIHGSPEDELHYLNTGELPPHLSDRCDRDSRSSPNEGGVPVCKQYIWNKCKFRNCKYKHVTVNEPRGVNCLVSSPLPLDKGDESVYSGQQFCQNIGFNEQYTIFPTSCFERGVKRSYSDSLYREEIGGADIRVDNINVPVFENSSRFVSRPERQPKRSYEMLEEENIILRERVSELKKRVDDLHVANEFLLEQNAQLRLRDKNSTGMTTVTVPAVTITNTVPGANQIQQTPTPQQMVNAAIRTVTASVATVPVSLATVTPVSLSAVSMAPVQISPPVVTMAQQAAPPPNDQVPQPLPMSISATTAPLVSYPIVSHPVMQPPPDMRH